MRSALRLALSLVVLALVVGLAVPEAHALINVRHDVLRQRKPLRVQLDVAAATHGSASSSGRLTRHAAVGTSRHRSARTGTEADAVSAALLGSWKWNYDARRVADLRRRGPGCSRRGYELRTWAGSTAALRRALLLRRTAGRTSTTRGWLGAWLCTALRLSPAWRALAQLQRMQARIRGLLDLGQFGARFCASSRSEGRLASLPPPWSRIVTLAPTSARRRRQRSIRGRDGKYLGCPNGRKLKVQRWSSLRAARPPFRRSRSARCGQETSVLASCTFEARTRYRRIGAA